MAIRRLSEGTYILRSNIQEWTHEQLWKTYIQLSEAEAAFRVHKSDLCIRPIWHHKKDRIKAHILICFLAYGLWKTLQKVAIARRLGRLAAHGPYRVVAYSLGRYRVATGGPI